MHPERQIAVITLFAVLMIAGTSPAQEQPTERLRLVASLGTYKEKTASISAGDIDGDGDHDLIVANGRHWAGQNRVFVNDGQGDFSVERLLYGQTDKTYATPLADLDGDGDLDVVVGNDRQPSYVLLNDGSGNFEKSEHVGGIVPTRSITLADIDKKAGIDILVTNRGAPNQIFFNDGKGKFARSAQFGSKTDSTIDVAVADLNGDGHNDLALANRDGQQNFVYFGDGTGNFPKSAKYGTGEDETRGVTVVDFDSDGHLDILNANIGEPNAIYFGDGTGKFERSVKFGGREDSYHLQCTRLDKKQKQPGIVVANVGAQNAVYIQKPDGTFERSLFGNKKSLFGAGQSGTYGVAVVDIDQDGIAEIATANSDGKNNLYHYSKPEAKD